MYMNGLGWITGFSCAFFHSLCYLASKRHTLRYPGQSMDLLLQGHLLMSLIAVPLTLFLWPSPFPPVADVLIFLFGSSIFYAGGQWFMMEAMRLTEPSRVSPLLGIKVLIMGLFATVALGHSLSGGQWLALVLCTLGAVSLGRSGRPLPRAAALRILLAAVCYVLSDSCIERLVNVHSVYGLPLLQAGLFSLGLTYSLLGGVALCVLPLRLRRKTPALPATGSAAPFAAFWILAMAMYYLTLGLVGPVMGVALQSTRGIVSICLGAVVARVFHRHSLEERLAPQIFLLRLTSAILMFGGILLYSLSGR